MKQKRRLFLSRNGFTMAKPSIPELHLARPLESKGRTGRSFLLLHTNATKWISIDIRFSKKTTGLLVMFNRFSFLSRCLCRLIVKIIDLLFVIEKWPGNDGQHPNQSLCKLKKSYNHMKELSLKSFWLNLLIQTKTFIVLVMIDQNGRHDEREAFKVGISRNKEKIVCRGNFPVLWDNKEKRSREKKGK